MAASMAPWLFGDDFYFFVFWVGLMRPVARRKHMLNNMGVFGRKKHQIGKKKWDHAYGWFACDLDVMNGGGIFLFQGPLAEMTSISRPESWKFLQNKIWRRWTGGCSLILFSWKIAATIWKDWKILKDPQKRLNCGNCLIFFFYTSWGVWLRKMLTHRAWATWIQFISTANGEDFVVV